MLRFRLLPLLPILMLVLACGPSKPEVNLNAEREAIGKLIPDLLKAELRRDIKASLTFLAPDAVIQLEGVPIQGPSNVSGTSAIRAMYEKIFEMPYTDLVWKPQSLVLAGSGDLAYETGYMNAVFEGSDATTVAPGEATIIWRKSDSQWKVAIMLISMDEPYTE